MIADALTRTDSLTLAEWDAGHIKRSRAVAEKIVRASGGCTAGCSYKKAPGHAEALAELLAWRALHPQRPFGDLQQPSCSHRAQSAAAPRVEKTVPVRVKPAPAKRTPTPTAIKDLSQFSSTKHCPRCSADLPRDTEHFNRKTRNADGLDDYCRPCKRAYNNNYAANTRRLQAQKEMANAG